MDEKTGRIPDIPAMKKAPNLDGVTAPHVEAEGQTESQNR